MHNTYDVDTYRDMSRHMVIDSATRDVIDKKMVDAVEWALARAQGSRKNGLPLLTSESAHDVFLSPAWSNRGGFGVKNAGLRTYLERFESPLDIAWAWLYHSDGVAVAGDFQRFSRGGDRSSPMADWQGRARRLVEWDRPFAECQCTNCAGDHLYTSTRCERLMELKCTMMNCLLIWSLTLMHGVWLVEDGVVRLGYGSRAALWVKFGSEFKAYDGAYTFQRLLELLAAMGTVVGDLTSLKPRKNGCIPRPSVPRPLKRPRRSILLDVFSGFQSLAYLAGVLGLTYVSVDISAVLCAGTSTFSATFVQDLSMLPHGEIIQCILETLGISAGCVALVWCSPPCRTFTGSDAANASVTEKRPLACNYRMHGPSYPTRPPRKAQFRGDPYRLLARLHDKLVQSLLCSLLSCGLKWIIENPAASLALRPYMKAAGCPTLAHYCAFCGSFFHKPAHFWNSTLREMSLVGFAGAMRCGRTAATCFCGHLNTTTGQWNHDNTIAGKVAPTPTSAATSVLKMKNSIPEGLQLAVARHFDLIE